MPLVVLAGKEYGSGSSRDWAAKGPLLLGVRAVIAESYERIHRSNLVGMGILPLQFAPGENAAIARSDRARDLRHPRPRRRERSARRPSRRTLAGGRGDELRRRPPHRHPAGMALLPQRRHPPVRAATVSAARTLRYGYAPWNPTRQESCCTVSASGSSRARSAALRPRRRRALERRPAHRRRGLGVLRGRARPLHDRAAGSELQAIERAERRVEEGS